MAIFQALISNIDMVMAKADIGIARRYARLCPDPKVSRKVFTKIKEEWLKTKGALSLLLGLENTCYQPLNFLSPLRCVIHILIR